MDEYQLAYVVTTWIILATLLISTVFWWSRQPKNLPPSPGICLPIIGHLYLLDAKNSRKQFKEWGEKIGRIFSLQMGASRYIVLNDFQLIKNLTIKHADTMTGRSTVNVLSQYVPSRFRGLIVSSGPLWKEQRATAMTILRNLGMGKSVLAEKISQEVSVYVRELSLLKGGPSNIKTLTNMSVSNVISSVIFGRRFEFDDPFFIKTVGQFNVLVELAATVSLANFLPFLIYLPFDIFGGRRLINTYREVQKCNEYMVEKVRTEFDPESGDNFIFSYIREMEKKEKSGQPTHLSLENLARCIDDLFVAGTETTSSTILWCLLYSIHHPDKQEKVYQEIIEQVGSEHDGQTELEILECFYHGDSKNSQYRANHYVRMYGGYNF